MSDTPQGPDWWQASDDRWYPPPRPDMPGDAGAASSPASAVMAPPGGPPVGPPVGPPTGRPSGGFPAGPPSGYPPGSGGGFPPGPPSPYGGMPPGAAPTGNQNKTPLYIAIAVVVAAALVGLIVVLAGGDDDDEPASPTTEQAPTTADDGATPVEEDPTATTEASEPSGDAAVAVVESGFSNFMGGFDQDERAVAYGFIVENSGDETATDISVTVSAYDASDTAVASESHTIYVLRPGEKIGIGDEFFGDTFATDVARIDIQVGEPSDYGMEDVPDEGALTAEGITTTASDYDLTTTFTARSTYAQQVDSPYAYAIYRDSGGNIIGGSTGYLDFIAANGTTAGEVSSWEAIPNVAGTEVYLDPGWF